MPEEEIANIEAEKPVFPGGIIAMYKFLEANIVYPEKAIESKLSGTVFVKWVIEKDGSVGEVIIMSDPGMGMGEALTKAIKSMPKFTPAMQNGKPVRYWYNAPFKFTLEDASANMPSKQKEDNLPEEEILTEVTAKPKFPGGMDAMLAFLEENIVYPEKAIENNLSGIVLVKWVIEKDGSVGEVVILSEPGMGMGDAVRDVVKSLPKFTPAKLDGKAVRYWFKAPFKFKTNADEEPDPKRDKKNRLIILPGLIIIK